MSIHGIPPGSDFVFQVVPHGDGTYDCVDTRTLAVFSNHVTLEAAQAQCVTKNSELDAL